MILDYDSREVHRLLDLGEYAPHFTAVITTRPDHLFKDSVCDECDHAAAVVIEYTVDDAEQGWIGSTDAAFCAEHAGPGVRCILDRPDRSVDHDTTVTVNYWAARYAFPIQDLARTA